MRHGTGFSPSQACHGKRDRAIMFASSDPRQRWQGVARFSQRRIPDSQFHIVTNVALCVAMHVGMEFPAEFAGDLLEAV